ncbi:MAG TPA: GNAT family N-acetyltransferase [Pelomicrobium sp.]|nr:GNAT family N-acetyltransferase [Pelomicrobium sp.]
MIDVTEHPEQLPAAQWNALAGGNPFLRHEFLAALHETGCASARTGWRPLYLTLRERGRLAGALPLYLKSHSFGEYVFDWAWADAYQRHGLAYYPKLLCAVPFTPASGPRVLAADPDHRRSLANAALALARESKVSSLHVLFPPDGEARELEAAGLMLRHGVQFHWDNAGYEDFEHYLASMSSAKRKKIRQERRRVAEAGVRFECRTGRDAAPEDWDFFFRCYTRTYRQHHSTPYLTLEFFRRLGATMPDNVLLVLGFRGTERIAAALDMLGGGILYGRYWGALDYVPGLHFEACYYQGIDYCIRQQLERFEGGAQGEHKVARGLLPTRTWSAHWLFHPEFADAVGDYLRREAAAVDRYIDELSDSAPFKEPT